MSCTHSTKPIEINNTFVWKVTDTVSGRYVYIPKREVFEYIRFRMDPLEGHPNTRMADAYELAEHGFGGRYTDYLPEEDILPCIKLIYTNFQVLNENGVQVFQPFGEWVLEEACNCLKQWTATGRMDLGDGFIVPSQDEWECIINGMFNGGMNFAGAVYTCAPDIVYPRAIIGFLEDAVRANTEAHNPRYNIIRNAHSEWKRINTPTSRVTLDNGLVVPSSEEIAKIEIGLNAGNDLTSTYTYYGLTEILPPENMRQCIEAGIRNTASTWIDIFKSCQDGQDGNKTLIYVAVGVGLLLLLFQRPNKPVRNSFLPQPMI